MGRKDGVQYLVYLQMAGLTRFVAVLVWLMCHAGQEHEELLESHLFQRLQIAHGVDFGHHALDEARIDEAVINFEIGLIENCDTFLKIYKLFVRIKEFLEECLEDLLVFL